MSHSKNASQRFISYQSKANSAFPLQSPVVPQYAIRHRRSQSVFSIIIFLAAATAISACAAPSQQPRAQQDIAKCESALSALNENKLEQHLLHINSDGQLLLPADGSVVTDEDKYVTSILESFQSAKASNDKLSLTIFIHGGLNGLDSARTRTKKIADAMLCSNQYLVYVSWDSGFWGNYADHLFFINHGTKSKWALLKSPIVFVEDVIRSVARIPISTYEIVAGQNVILKSIGNREETSANYFESKLDIGPHGFNVWRGTTEVGFSASDWLTIANPVKLLTYPVADGFGTGSWDSMLRRTDLVLRKSAGYNAPPEPKKSAVPTFSTAAAKFLSRWQARLPNEAVTLIAHSAGTIVANNILTEYDKIGFSKIVYMAAACRVKDIETVVSPYMRSHSSVQFYSLSLNPYEDLAENEAYDFVPRGSLLVWIDQIFGHVDSFDDRTAGFWFTMIRAADKIFPKEVRERVHLTRFGINDNTPRKHGDFNDWRFWDPAFWNGDMFASECRRAGTCHPMPT